MGDFTSTQRVPRVIKLLEAFYNRVFGIKFGKFGTKWVQFPTATGKSCDLQDAFKCLRLKPRKLPRCRLAELKERFETRSGLFRAVHCHEFAVLSWFCIWLRRSSLYYFRGFYIASAFKSVSATNQIKLTVPNQGWQPRLLCLLSTLIK